MKQYVEPTDLQKLMKEAFLNNTYDYDSMQTEIDKAWFNSFSYLYNFQKAGTEYQDLEYQSGDVESRDLLKGGHLFLDRSSNINVIIDYDFIHTMNREEYYKGIFNIFLTKDNYKNYLGYMMYDTSTKKFQYLEKSNYQNFLNTTVRVRTSYYRPFTIEEMIINKSIFTKIPILIIDDRVIWDYRVVAMNDNLRFILPLKNNGNSTPFNRTYYIKSKRKTGIVNNEETTYYVRSYQQVQGAVEVVRDDIEDFDPNTQVKYSDVVKDIPDISYAKKIEVSPGIYETYSDWVKLIQKNEASFEYVDHHIQVLIVDNSFYTRFMTTKENDDFRYYPITNTLRFKKSLVEGVPEKAGILMCSLHFPNSSGTHYELGSCLIPMEVEVDTNGVTWYTSPIPQGLGNEIFSTSSKFYVSCVFVEKCYVHYFADDDNTNLRSLSREVTEYNGVKNANAFVLCDPYEKEFMQPVPIENLMIFETNSSMDGYTLKHNVDMVDIHYPNIYTFKDDAVNVGSKYRIFYMYHDNDDLQYTNIFRFYYIYLNIVFNGKRYENIIDGLYHDSINLTSIFDTGTKRIAFMNTFKKFMDYGFPEDMTTKGFRYRGMIDSKHPLPTTGITIGHFYKINEEGTYAGYRCAVGDILVAKYTKHSYPAAATAWTHISVDEINNTPYFKHLFGEDDFNTRYRLTDWNGKKINKYKEPIEYKDETLKDWIRIEPFVLRDYVVEQKKLSEFYYLFTNVFTWYTRTTSATSNALLVVSDDIELEGRTYSSASMVKHEMVKLTIPDIEIGEYVIFHENLSSRLREDTEQEIGYKSKLFAEPRYVFAIDNTLDYPDNLEIRVHVDGLYVEQLYQERKMYSEYIYIPSSMVTYDSLIEIEIYPWFRYKEQVRFESLDDVKDVEMEVPKDIKPTMADVYFALLEDERIRYDEEWFDIKNHYDEEVINTGPIRLVVPDDYSDNPSSEELKTRIVGTLSTKMSGKELEDFTSLLDRLPERAAYVTLKEWFEGFKPRKIDPENPLYDSYKVVSNTEPDFDANTMIALVNAQDYVPDAEIGDQIMLGKFSRVESKLLMENLELLNGTFNSETMIHYSDVKDIVPDIEPYDHVMNYGVTRKNLVAGDFMTTTWDDEKPVKFTRLRKFSIRPNDETVVGQDFMMYFTKTSFRFLFKIRKQGYPYILFIETDWMFNAEYIRLFRNGRLLSRNRWSFNSTYGYPKLLILEDFDVGDYVMIDIIPYRYKEICYIDKLPAKDLTLDLSEYINKPFSPRYYDVFMNGRKLSIQNIFPVSPWEITLVNLKSIYNFEIYEKERDWEYFGLNYKEKIYYFTIDEILDSIFITEEQSLKLLIRIIREQKHPRVFIYRNTNDEEVMDHSNMRKYGEMYTFYHDQYIPRTFHQPDMVQVNRETIQDEYTGVYDTYHKQRVSPEERTLTTEEVNFKERYPHALLLDPDKNIGETPTREITSQKKIWVFPTGHLKELDPEYYDDNPPSTSAARDYYHDFKED